MIGPYVRDRSSVWDFRRRDLPRNPVGSRRPKHPNRPLLLLTWINYREYTRNPPLQPAAKKLRDMGRAASTRSGDQEEDAVVIWCVVNQCVCVFFCPFWLFHPYGCWKSVGKFCCRKIQPTSYQVYRHLGHHKSVRILCPY